MSSSTLEGKKKTENGTKRLIFTAVSILLEIVFLLFLFTKVSEYATIIDWATRIVAIFLVLGLYSMDKTSSMKMPWIILMLAFPILGVSLYLLVGLNGSTKKMRARYEEIDKKLLPYLPDNRQILEWMKEESPQAGAIASYLTNYSCYPVYQNTDVTYYDEAIKGLDAQLEDLSKAEKFIFMEYHAIEDEEAWQRIQTVLEDRVKAGVEVRIFYDDMGSIWFVNMDFATKLKSLGIKCRVFNPILPGLNMFLNNRDHRKITVIDGKVAFTGGVNLADEYINKKVRFGHWKDTGVRIHGEAVFNFSMMFLEMWNAVSDKDKNDSDFNKFLPDYKYVSSQTGFIQPYADSPLDNEQVGEEVYISMVNKSEKVLVLNSSSKNYVEKINSGKADLCPNFVLTNQISDYHKIRDRIEKVIYVGDVRLSKGSDDFYLLAKQNPEVKFIVVGSVTEEIAQLDKPKNVHTLGRLEATDVEKQLNDADVFVFPSLTEGFSNAMLEAMAHGLPIIATDVGAATDMIENCGGTVVSIHDVSAMQSALNNMNKPETRKAMSEWNINKVKQCYEYNQVKKKILQVYEEDI